jgi:methanethiol oxidase
MKSPKTIRMLLGSAATLALLAGMAAPAAADETCQSPYMAKITGHEEFVYVWTLGVDGVGDESDKVVTIDVREDSPTFGQVIDVDSVGGQHEAHHGGFTDDRRFFWVAGLDTNQIFIFDVATDPGNPELVKTITDFTEKSGGVVGPHGAYALPGRMLISACPTRMAPARRGWSSIPTRANTSPPTGCRRPRTPKGPRTARWPTATAMTHACCRARTSC